MIVPDTHVWIWLADGGDYLSSAHEKMIDEHRTSCLGVGAISCWEVAKLVEDGRLRLACIVEEWMDGALALPGLHLLELTPRIAIESTKLPGEFHRDPADQIIVATARIHDLELLMVDEQMLKYPHVRAV